MIRTIGIEGLYYITHVNNIKSILTNGILCHRQIEQAGIEFTKIYDVGIVSNRQHRSVDSNRVLWDFANLYFQPRNAMLYRVLRESNNINDIAILFVSPDILNRDDIYISNGNAASLSSDFFPGKEGLKILSKITKQINHEWWNDNDGSKRKMMAECLVPGKIDQKYIRSIYVGSEKLHSRLTAEIKDLQSKIEVSLNHDMFFIPSWKKSILGTRISLVKGDMFFSRMQTLTISVNCVGIMGKGLASTAKYRFPDVYVEYQDLCKKKSIKMGLPYIYQRESSVFNELADEVSGDESAASQTWFLLFPTKNHWRNDADREGIEQGLKWLVDNYKNKGITSIAMPALGCGLGQLEWREIGPLMCRYLSKMDIDSIVYLPMEGEVPSEFLDPKFLMSRTT